LLLIPEGCNRYRASAFNCLAWVALDAKDLASAQQWIRQAEALDLGLLNAGKLNWTIAKAFASSGLLDDARTAFHQATEQLLAISPINAALCAIDLCEALIGFGKTREAHRTAGAMARIVGALRGSRQAQAAIIELSRMGLRGEGLTRALLVDVRTRVSRARR
jgi:hypothetical protein